MQEAIERHSNGIKFRERNAGSQIDNDMSDQGNSYTNIYTFITFVLLFSHFINLLFCFKASM